MDALVGYITLNNINKSKEYLIPYAVIALGFLFAMFYGCIKNRIYIPPISQEKSEHVIRRIMLTFVFILVLTNTGKSGPLLYIMSIFLAELIDSSLSNFDQSKKDVLFFILLPYLLLIAKAVTSTQYAPAIVILIVFFTIFLWRCGKEAFSVLVLIFFIKNFYVGPFEVGDAFHGAEHFLASIEWRRGFFAVFPNLGYLEEFSAYAFLSVVKALSLGYVQMSIQTARSLLVIGLLLIIASQIFYRNKLLAAFFLIALPTDRVSLLIALCCSTLIIASNDRVATNLAKKLGLAVVFFFPLIALGLSPSYVIIPMLAFAGMLPFENFNRKYFFIISAGWFLTVVIFHRAIISYLTNYLEITTLFTIAYSTSITSVSKWDLYFWLVLLFVTTLSVLEVFRVSDGRVVKTFKIAVALFVLIKCTDYGFGRIDPGYSRLVSIAIPLMLVSSFFSKGLNIISVVILSGVIVTYLQFSLPRGFIKSDLFFNNVNNRPVQLNAANEQSATEIGKYAKGRPVINYSNEPALVISIPNGMVAPFTSPYVTVGEKSQQAVIQFMKSHPSAIVYLGRQFIVFDGVDARLRTPLVFRFLAQNYQYVNEYGRIYAVPNKDSSKEVFESPFFSNLDLQKSVVYYSTQEAHKFEYQTVTINCPTQEPGKYKIINEMNTFSADFKCGANKVPLVFFLGSIRKISKEY